MTGNEVKMIHICDRMKTINGGFSKLIKNPELQVAVDANFFIPPDRSNLNQGSKVSFQQFCENWLNPMFEAFGGLSIHEAVYDELQIKEVREYVDNMISSDYHMQVLRDEDLLPYELAMRNTIEKMISPNTNYDPFYNNSRDRGEVKTLSYIKTRGIFYFASNDNAANLLIDEAAKLGTGLEDIYSVRFYELIYYLYKKEYGNSEGLRTLYKNYYYLTKREKERNPSWGEFIVGMNSLYGELLKK